MVLTSFKGYPTILVNLSSLSNYPLDEFTLLSHTGATCVYPRWVVSFKGGAESWIRRGGGGVHY